MKIKHNFYIFAMLHVPFIQTGNDNITTYYIFHKVLLNNEFRKFQFQIRNSNILGYLFPVHFLTKFFYSMLAC